MSRTAVLFFHQSSEQDFRRRNGRFTPRQFRHLHRWQVKRTRTLLQELDVPVFDKFIQQGDTFGERLLSCLEQIRSQGYNRVLVVGRDCPTLQREDLTQALRGLQQGKVYLGPDFRGGTYLMSFGLDTATLKGLSTIRWQTAHVLADLQQLFPDATLLNHRPDINELADVFTLKHTSAAHYWAILYLLRLLPSGAIKIAISFVDPLARSRFYLRPPPIFS